MYWRKYSVGCGRRTPPEAVFRRRPNFRLNGLPGPFLEEVRPRALRHRGCVATIVHELNTSGSEALGRIGQSELFPVFNFVAVRAKTGGDHGAFSAKCIRQFYP